MCSLSVSSVLMAEVSDQLSLSSLAQEEGLLAP